MQFGYYVHESIFWLEIWVAGLSLVMVVVILVRGEVGEGKVKVLVCKL